MIFGDSGCSGHHFEEYRKLPEYRFKSGYGDHQIVEQKTELTCQHEGCTESKTVWRSIRTLSFEEADDMRDALEGSEIGGQPE